ncbi:unnamed protein product [Lota lota]
MAKKILTALEKSLILLFVILTGACVGLVAIYFTENNNNASIGADGLDSGCGGPQVLSGDSGTFTSWRFPNHYDNGRGCSWQITVAADKVIQLWFQEFALEESHMCMADFVTLRDSLGTMGKYCGYTKPMPLVTLENRLMVYFDTNDIKTDQGFKAHYKAVAPESTAGIAGAGGSLQGDMGDLLTPGFPAQNYQNGALYQWRISVPKGERVRLTFTSFDLVPELCGDYVEVFDGHKAGAARLGKLCGGKLPKPLESSGSTMSLRFRTDATLTSRGFSATYTKSSLPPVVIPTTTPRPVTTPADSGCGGPALLSGRKGVIQSLGFPSSYPADLHCSWSIMVPRGRLVELQFTDMAIPGEMGRCPEDTLTISDSYRTLGTYCGYVLPPVLVSAGDTMVVRFRSDSRLTDRGFSAKWHAVYPEDIPDIQGCGVSSHQETGLIKSPNWPMNYDPNGECLWTIEVPAGKHITLNFTHFDIEAKDLLSPKCLDYVEMQDIRASDGELVDKYGPFCGSKLPPSVQTKGNRLVIRFTSDLFTEGPGFRAYWSTNTSLPAPTEPPPPPNPWDDIIIDWPVSCGKPAIPPAVNTRIVNGEPARPNSWPWQVSMQVWPANRPTPIFSHTCGGTLIHKNWVLTAAHCFINYADELQRWRMCLGKHNLTYEEPSERCFAVSGIFRHEGFRYPTVPTVEFDIALVRLTGAVEESQEVSYACLPSPEEVLMGGTNCYATGWGDETGNSMSPKVAEALNQVALPVMPYATCKRADYWWFQVKSSMICCGYILPDELKSVCQGDSGGPLVCQDTPISPWEVHGITSFGPIGCIMDKKPSVFTRSSAYIPWIHNVIRKDIYHTHSSGCGGPKVLTGPTGGNLSSMGFPSSYSNQANCQWTITAPAGQLVHLHFHQLTLEESTFCINDKLSVTDRLGSLGTFCSHTAPQDLVSHGEELRISFSSNARIVDTGFLASWRPVDPSQAPCGGRFSSNQGEVTSPGWPSDYPSQAVCTWLITIPSATTIHLAFTHFEVQAANMLGKCVDYVEIFQGPNMFPKGRFCGFAPPPKVTIDGNTAIIRFLSNGDNHQSGFRGYWTTDASVVPTLPPPPVNPWDNITITWPDECGSPAVTPSNATLRVVNGVESVPHSWPWQVSMQATPIAAIPYMHGCGGSLIHEEWILTAAHCFMMPLNSPTFWRMCLGKHHMNSSRDVPSAEACYQVDSIVRHTGFVYEQDRSDISNDVALVHLARPVNMTREISPVCMPAPGAVLAAGTPCYVTGWGDEKGSLFPKVSQQLNQAALPVVDFGTCSKPAYWWDVLRPSMICAGYESPDELKSACQGDSGGPFVCQTTGATKSSWEVHGIVSFGAQGCIKDKKPSVFTRVSAFSGWIEDNIRRPIWGPMMNERGPIYLDLNVSLLVLHHKAAVQVKEDMKKMVHLPMLRPWPITASTSSTNITTTTAIATAEVQSSRQFGVSLSELCALGLVAEEDGVPKVVCRMVEHLRQHALHQEGLFRVNGNVRAVESLKQRLQSGEEVDLLAEGDVCTVASLLKQYLRDLPEGLVDSAVQAALIQQYQERGEEGSWGDLRAVLRRMPDVHHRLLSYFCRFLTEVARHHPHNRMTALNLATVFGPSIFHVSPGFEAIKEQNICNKIMAELIQNYSNIFDSSHDLDKDGLTGELPTLIIVKEVHLMNVDSERSPATSSPRTPKTPVKKGTGDEVSLAPPQPSFSAELPHMRRLAPQPMSHNLETMEMTPHPPSPPPNTSPSSSVDLPDCLPEEERAISPFYMSNHLSPIHCRPDVTSFLDRTIRAAVQQHLFEINPLDCPGVQGPGLQGPGFQGPGLQGPGFLGPALLVPRENTTCFSPPLTSSARQRRRQKREQKEEEEGEREPERSRADLHKENIPWDKDNYDSLSEGNVAVRVAPQRTQRVKTNQSNHHQHCIPKPWKPRPGPTLAQQDENQDTPTVSDCYSGSSSCLLVDLASPPLSCEVIFDEHTEELEAGDSPLHLDQCRPRMKIQESPGVCVVAERPPHGDCSEPRDDVPRLELAEEDNNNWGEPVPAYSSWQRDSMDREEARPSPHAGGQLIRQLMEEGSDPMLSPRFYGYGQQYLDDTEVPPSPPNAHSFTSRRRSSSLGSCDEEKEELSSAQLSKRIHVLKKKIHRFEERFEYERKYRPSHSDKLANPEVLRWVNELTRLRRDLKEHKLLKSEEDLPPLTRQRSNTLPKSFGSQLDKRSPQEKVPLPPVESTLEAVMGKLQEKREEVGRPEDIKDMTREQIGTEKLALQKALLYYESIHGRPVTKNERQTMKPLYDRYRLVKQILCRASSIPVIGSPSSMRRGPLLQPIIEGVPALFFDDIKEEEDGSEDDGDSKPTFPVSDRPNLSMLGFLDQLEEEVDGFISPVDDLSPSRNTTHDMRLSNLHSATMQELVEQLQETREEKKRIRMNLREYEDQFFRENGRNVQKEDRSPLAVEYNEYKHVKAKLKLLEVLISKRNSTKFI